MVGPLYDFHSDRLSRPIRGRSTPAPRENAAQAAIFRPFPPRPSPGWLPIIRADLHGPAALPPSSRPS